LRRDYSEAVLFGDIFEFYGSAHCQQLMFNGSGRNIF